MVRPGDQNAFGLTATVVKGRMVDLRCPVCGQAGSVPVDEFASTRCGSAQCGGTQGKVE